MWLLFTIIATICFALSRIFQKAFLNKKTHDPITYAIFFQFLVSLCLLPTAIMEGFILPPLSQISVGLILCIIFYSLANVLCFTALKKIPVSEFTILLATIPIWTTLTSIIILQESTQPVKLIGILLTVLGIVITFYAGKKFFMTKYHYLTLLAAICYGFGATNDASLLQHFTPSMYGFVSFLLCSSFLALIYYKKVGGISPYIKNGLIAFIAPSILYALYTLGVNMAYKTGGEISRIVTINQSSIILVILFGIFFFQEKEHLKKKITGGCIVLIGALLVQAT